MSSITARIAGASAALLVVAGVVAPSAFAGGQVGSTTAYSGSDLIPAQVAQVYRFTSSAAGSVDRLNVNLATGNAATQVKLGIYSGNSSSASSRLATCTVTSPIVEQWNSCTFTPITLTSSTTYWLGILAVGGSVEFHNSTTGNVSFDSSSTSLTSLPTTWTNGTNWGAQTASLYADQAPAAPSADFSISSNPTVGTPVNFTSTGTCAATPCTYSWKHAAVQFGTGTTASYTYTESYSTKHVTLRVTDALSRTSSITKDFTVAADTTAPDTTITSHPTDPTTDTSATFDFTSSEAGSTFQCQIDGGSYSSCSTGQSYTSLAIGSHAFNVRATDASSNTDATPASFSWDVEALVTCDSTVSTRSAFVAALGDTGNSGDTVCVDADITGQWITAPGNGGGSGAIGTDFSSMTRFVAQPNDGTVHMVPIEFQGTTNVTIEGFDFDEAGVADSCCQDTNHLYIKGNHFHDYEGDALDLFGQATKADIQFIGNRVDCLTGTGSGGSGYGVRTFGGPFDSPKFNYNTITGCGNSGDGMEIGALLDFEVIGNEITGIGGPADAHTDGLMIWGGSDTGLVKDNRITDGPGTLISPDGQDITFENNLIANHHFATGSDQCVDAMPNGTSGTLSPLRFTFIRNTIYDCGNGALNITGPIGARGDNVLTKNLLEDISCSSPDWTGEGPGVFSSADHNLTGGGCAISGTNDLSFTPTFADTVDYLPTNLPSGYQDVGYRAAPAGYLAAP
jgi:hypothetical protein